MKKIFPLIPAPTVAVGLLAVIGLVQVGLAVLVGHLLYGIRHLRVEVSSTDMAIRGDLYARSIPLADLVVEQARMLDLQADEAYRPAARTNGTGLPGYQAGWFRLRNGEKALAFVTDPQHVAYIPTRRGYSLLVSVAGPGDLIRALLQAT